MTAVLFKFTKPDGTPVADAPFRVTTRKPSFDETLHNGIQVPGDVDGVTDAQGEATMVLVAGFATYYLIMDNPNAPEDSDGCIAGLRYRFMVPESDVPVRIEDLIVTSPTFSRPWDETALQIIIDAKALSQAAAVAAKASEVAAGEFAVRAEDAVAETGENAAAAAESARSAGLSATAAGDSASAAQQARNETEGFRNQARTSELAAAGSATAAADSFHATELEVIKAQEYAEQSETSAGSSEAARVAAVAASEAAAGSATLAGNSATAANASKLATAADVVTVTGLKGDTQVLHDEAKEFRDEALAAVGTITGVFTDGGLVDLSGGAYPAKPTVSTIWKVSVGGTVTTANEGTIVYVAGDQLVYTKAQDLFYKNDQQSAVTKVNGKSGDVTLTKADIGLPLADNTPDTDKPISTAQQAAFAARTPTVGRQDTTAGRLIKVGDYGENGGGAIVQSASVDANTLTVGGTYVFNGGGINLPAGAGPVYLKHFNHAVANYSKQFAYGLLNDSCYVRTNNNSVWSDWKPLVDIVDSLTSADPAKALSARQGKLLLEMLQSNNATIVRYTFNVAVGQTTITGNSLEGIPLSYVPGVPFMVEKDGFPIWLGKDYTASNGTSITLTFGPYTASEVAITVFGAFSAADHYTKAQADARYYQKAQTYTQTEINDKLATVAANAAEAVGTIKWVPSVGMIPAGAFPMDGGLFSRTTYPDMWALIRDGKVPVVSEANWLANWADRASFTVGDGSTTFRVPDYNGKSSGTIGAIIQRGENNGTGIGKIQRDAFQNHSVAFRAGKASAVASTDYSSVVVGSAAAGNEAFAGSANYRLGMSSFEAIPGYGTVRTDGETRPINVAGIWTIRLFGSVTNVGNVDVAQLASNLAATQAEVARLNTLDRGLITGLVLKHDSNTQVTVSAGSAYIPSVNGIVTLAADTSVATGSLTASSWYHLYLYGTGNSGGIELSLAKPVKYYGTAYNKTGDTSRRYLGSVLSNSAGTGVWAFVHEPTRCQMNFNVSVPSGAPFNSLWQGFTSTTPVLVNNTEIIVPIETTTEIHAINSSGAGMVQVSPADAIASPGSGNWDYACSGIGHLIIRLARKGPNIGRFYAWMTASATSSCYVRGYVFER